MRLAPIMFPTDRDDCFLTMAVTVVTSSGREVPIATMVAEMTAWETPLTTASSVAESTRNSAPNTIPAAPRINLATLIGISFLTSGIFSQATDSFFAPRTLSIMATAKMGRSRILPQREKPLPKEARYKIVVAASRRIDFSAY